MFKLFRKTHLYVGVFIAPALLFFAFTGALQTFSLHETTKGSDYKPPAWIMKLAQLHKNQNIVLRKPRPDDPAKPAAPKPATLKIVPSPDAPPTPQAAATTPSVPPAPAPKPKSHLPMKIFFLLIAIGLFTSTLTGIYMSYKYERNKLLVTLLLIAGIVVPILLLPF